MAAKRNKLAGPLKSVVQKTAEISFQQKAGVSALLVILCLLVFAQVSTFKFVNYDDDIFVSENPHIQDGLSRKGIKWAFGADLLFDSPNADYWQPVTFLSRMLDVELWGDNPGGHHFTNLILHVGNVILIFILFMGMTGALWPSAWLAAAFAVHPLQVDSVSWVTERKDVLSAFWALLAFLNYWKYTQEKSFAKYLAALFFFLLSLLSKPTLILFPFLLLLLDYWPLSRIERVFNFRNVRQLCVEKLPFIFLSLGSVFITLFTHSGTMQLSTKIASNFQIPSLYLKYLKVVAWPINLVVVYPFKIYPLNLEFWVCSSAIILICGIIIWLARRCPYLFVGWFWFLSALFPAVAIVYSTRFMYVSILGILMIAAWWVPEYFKKRGWSSKTLAVFSAGLIFIWAGYSHKQTSYWKDSLTLCNHILSVTRDNPFVENGLGATLLSLGRFDEAEMHMRRAIALDPKFVYPYNNLGLVLVKQGKYPEAEAQYRMVIKISPDFFAAYNNLAIVLAVQGRMQEAIDTLTYLLSKVPDDPTAHAFLGKALAQTGKVDLAIEHLNKALEINPRDVATLNELAVLLIGQKYYDEAIELFQRAVSLKPDDFKILNNLYAAQKEKIKNTMQRQMQS